MTDRSTQYETVSYRKMWDGAYKVTFDGVTLGDSPTYDTAQQASDAAMSFVNEDHAAAKRDNRPRFRVYRAGY